MISQGPAWSSSGIVQMTNIPASYPTKIKKLYQIYLFKYDFIYVFYSTFVTEQQYNPLFMTDEKLCLRSHCLHSQFGANMATPHTRCSSADAKE